MAATVLNSRRAVQMSIFVVRAFLKLREWVAGQPELSTGCGLKGSSRHCAIPPSSPTFASTPNSAPSPGPTGPTWIPMSSTLSYQEPPSGFPPHGPADRASKRKPVSNERQAKWLSSTSQR